MKGAIFFSTKDTRIILRRIRMKDVVNFYLLKDLMSGKLSLANEHLASAKTFRELYLKFHTWESDGYRCGNTRTELMNGIKFTTDMIEDIIQADDPEVMFDFCGPIFASHGFNPAECKEKILQLPNCSLTLFKDAYGTLQTDVFISPITDKFEPGDNGYDCVFSELGVPWLVPQEKTDQQDVIYMVLTRGENEFKQMPLK